MDRKPPDNEDDEQSVEPKEDQAEKDVIVTSSSSDGGNVTVISNTELPGSLCIPVKDVEGDRPAELNGNHPESGDTDGGKSTDISVVDDTEGMGFLYVMNKSKKNILTSYHNEWTAAGKDFT